MSKGQIGLYRARGRKKPYLVRWHGEIDPATGEAKRYCRSFRTKAQAENFKAEKMAEIKRTGRRDRRPDESLKRLCDDFLRTKKANVRPSSLRLYHYTTERLLKHFGADRSVASITVKDADLFMSEQVTRQRGEVKLSDWSRLQIVNHCRTIFGAAVRWDMIPTNPFKAISKPKPRPEKWHHLKADEYHRLLEAAPDERWKAFYALAYTSGAREGELFSLTWGQVDFEQGILRIENRKGTPDMPPFRIKDTEPRSVPIPEGTLDILTEWQAKAPEGVPYILLTQDRYERVLVRWRKLGMVDDRWENRYMVNNVLRGMRVHARRAGITFDGEFTIHCFRKSFGQNYADKGIPIKTLQFLMGHADEKTTLTFYTQVPKDHADKARETMQSILNSGKPQETDAQLTRNPIPNADANQQGNGAEAVNPDSTRVCGG